MKHTDPERSEPTLAEKRAAKIVATPLTEDAQTHLTAAAWDVEDAFFTMREMIESAIAPLTEANRYVGFEVTLTDDEACHITRCLRGALDFGSDRVVHPVYKRARGQRPHAESEDCPPRCTHRRREPSANGGGKSEGAADEAFRDWAKETADQLRSARQALGRYTLDTYFTGDDLPDPPFWWYPIRTEAEALEEILEKIAAGEPMEGDVRVMHAQACTLNGLAERLGPRHKARRKELRAAAQEAAGIARRIAEGGAS